MSDRVSISISAHIAHVTLTRADKMNALDTAMFSAICEAIDHVAAEPDVRLWWYRGKAVAFVPDWTSPILILRQNRWH
jgi:enoyl-CoA hydratase/carnithine racemase